MRSLLGEWEGLQGRLKARRIFLFLDYDGTLAPIISSPKTLSISKEMKGLLCLLSKRPDCRLAIISGRDVKYIINAVRLKKIIYSGNHGFQIEGPKIKFESPVPQRYRAALGRMRDDLTENLAFIKGAFVEDKGLSLSLHYRRVNKKERAQVKAVFHKVIAPYLRKNIIKINIGKMLLEVRPPSGWGKGKAVLWLLARERALKNTNPLPIYIGDDRTDEDAFKALKQRGVTVFVGAPKRSSARYYLKDTHEVKKFLKRLCRKK